MKTVNFKIIIFSAFLINILSCKAQTLPLNTALSDIPANAYVKDLNNELSPYIGTYKANFKDNEITLFITKEENKLEKSSKKTYFMDALIVKYIVKKSTGTILQDTKNNNSVNNQLYSIGTRPYQNSVIFYYSGTNCRVGWGKIILKKTEINKISWEYRPNDITLDNSTCPAGTDINIYLPETKDLIFTKQ
ncbi:DUF6705 family protein [Chryseobacterium gallinarum]|uniref:DUF6705 domain-containing protein n=1 Tax=Chryseobacterium gallinarum TaxID=1324352 RepID=A0ABX6KQE4_CHRGL|nr:DUF6705 family protein [Chryseobacterium gallinarum]MCL8537064.1 hypothetical protein [Chryseobacterium gallinarum]QIY90847.1 hypothetical protein FOB44_09335 [Chryseobacterium gallinarum]